MNNYTGKYAVENFHDLTPYIWRDPGNCKSRCPNSGLSYWPQILQIWAPHHAAWCVHYQEFQEKCINLVVHA